jgi:hypothetical protein
MRTAVCNCHRFPPVFVSEHSQPQERPAGLSGNRVAELLGPTWVVADRRRTRANQGRALLSLHRLNRAGSISKSMARLLTKTPRLSSVTTVSPSTSEENARLRSPSVTGGDAGGGRDPPLWFAPLQSSFAVNRPTAQRAAVRQTPESRPRCNVRRPRTAPVENGNAWSTMCLAPRFTAPATVSHQKVVGSEPIGALPGQSAAIGTMNSTAEILVLCPLGKHDGATKVLTQKSIGARNSQPPAPMHRQKNFVSPLLFTCDRVGERLLGGATGLISG